MSIFGTIMDKIFHHAAAATPADGGASPSPSSSASPTAPASSGPTLGSPTSANTSQAAATQMADAQPEAAPQASGRGSVDVAAVMNGLASKSSEKLDWKHSIVDMMKLLGLDSSLSARQELAKELNYNGDMHDSAGMNIWLHKQVMQKLAENGGKVPDDLRV